MTALTCRDVGRLLRGEQTFRRDPLLVHHFLEISSGSYDAMTGMQCGPSSSALQRKNAYIKSSKN